MIEVRYTDGLLESRNARGKLYGFERLLRLFAISPDARQASEAAVRFGLDDDITAVLFTRPHVGNATDARDHFPAIHSLKCLAVSAQILCRS
jgi:stage II sporulation SpoE-like protein